MQEMKKDAMPDAVEIPVVANDAMRLRRLATIGGYAISVVLAGAAGYAFRTPVVIQAPVNNDTSVAVMPGEYTTTQPTLDDSRPVSTPPASSNEDHPTITKAETLKIEWMAPRVDPSARFFEQYIEYVPGERTAFQPTYTIVGRVLGKNDLLPQQFLYTVAVPCDGMCFGPTVFRFLHGEDGTFLLRRYSKDLTGFRGDFTILSNTRIAAYEFPKTITGPHGETLDFVDWYDETFSVATNMFSFHSDAVGDVFTDKPLSSTGGSKRNGFYAPVADGTYVAYTVRIPFMTTEGGSVPKITWKDGAKNTYDYSSTDVYGCGSRNLISVIDTSVVDRSRDLTAAGTASNGDTVFVLKNTQHEILKSIHGSTYFNNDNDQSTQPYDEFIAAKPLFFWVDTFDRLVKFQRTAYQPMAECGKPVIYLYPEKTTDVSVQVVPKGGMTVSEPAYGNGWNVTASPDGTLVNHADGATYPYLFWEGRGGLYERPSAGTVVAREDVPTFLTDTLAKYGLNSKEIGDFEEFWLPLMKEKPFYFVTFMTTRAMNQIAPLTVDPQPDTIFRILMDYEPLDAPIAVTSMPTPHSFVRKGFTVVEWGGVLGRE